MTPTWPPVCWTGWICWARWRVGSAPFVSATRNPRGADRYRYQIAPAWNGVDVGATLRRQQQAGLIPDTWAHPRPEEQEVVVLGSIAPEEILSVYDQVEDRTGFWNPDTQSIEWAKGQLQGSEVRRDDRRRWVGRLGGALHIRRFEARRYRLRSGDFETRAVVRIFLDRVDGSPVTEDQLGEVGRRAQEGVDERYNGGHRLRNGDLFRVDLEFVTRAQDPHHTVTVHAKYDRENHKNWSVTTDDFVLAHEVGHLLGLEDEYRENTAYGERTVYQDESLMAGYDVDGRGRPILDQNHLVDVARLHRRRIAPRHLRQLGSAIEAALGTAGLRVDGQAVFSTEDSLRPRADGLPTRAHFSLETRVAVLYGEPRVGGGGHLPPSGMSARPRPVELEGTANPNGTYRAEYPGLPVRPELADRSHPLAGDLHVPQRQPKRGQMMFPAHWDEDDAVYAAEQAYLHALREGNVRLVEGRPGVYVWTGEYDGVRITGELVIGKPRRGFAYDLLDRETGRPIGPPGEGFAHDLDPREMLGREIVDLWAGDSSTFTGFRPSDDQPDEPGPAHAAPPPPAERPQTGTGGEKPPVFGQRVEDVARYGDRRTRSGVYHEPNVDRWTHEMSYGLVIDPAWMHHNDTYEANVFFLDPALRPGPRRTRRVTDGIGICTKTGITTSCSPKSGVRNSCWMPLSRRTTRADGVHVPAGGRPRHHHWVGYAEGIRMEGLERDGHHLAYRPTQMQPYTYWPAQKPVGEAVTREERVLPSMSGNCCSTTGSGVWTSRCGSAWSFRPAPTTTRWRSSGADCRRAWPPITAASCSDRGRRGTGPSVGGPCREFRGSAPLILGR